VGSLSARPFLFSSSGAWVVFGFYPDPGSAGLTQASYGKASAHSLQLSMGACGAAVRTPCSGAGHLSVCMERELLGPSLSMRRDTSSRCSRGARSLWSAKTLGVAASRAIRSAVKILVSGAAMFLARALWRLRRDRLYQRGIALGNVLIVGADGDRAKCAALISHRCDTAVIVSRFRFNM